GGGGEGGRGGGGGGGGGWGGGMRRVGGSATRAKGPGGRSFLPRSGGSPPAGRWKGSGDCSTRTYRGERTSASRSPRTWELISGERGCRSARSRASSLPGRQTS